MDRVPGGAGGERYRVLASSLLGKSMSPFVVRPTENPADDPHPEHAGQEFVFVHAGRVELDYGGSDHRAGGRARRARQHARARRLNHSAGYQGRVEQVTPVVALWVTTTWPSTAIWH